MEENNPILEKESVSETDMIITETNSELNVSQDNSHYRGDLEDLLKQCLSHKKAHADCESIHFMYDKIIKISTLVLSTTTTYFIASHDEEHMTSGDLEIDRILTVLTTLVSGINAIFNFAEKIEIHKSLHSEYGDLFKATEYTMRLFDEKMEDKNMRRIYDGHYNAFRDLNKRTSDIGIMKYIENRHGTT